MVGQKPAACDQPSHTLGRAAAVLEPCSAMLSPWVWLRCCCACYVGAGSCRDIGLRRLARREHSAKPTPVPLQSATVEYLPAALSREAVLAGWSSGRRKILDRKRPSADGDYCDAPAEAMPGTNPVTARRFSIRPDSAAPIRPDDGPRPHRRRWRAGGLAVAIRSPSI